MLFFYLLYARKQNNPPAFTVMYLFLKLSICNKYPGLFLKVAENYFLAQVIKKYGIFLLRSVYKTLKLKII